MRQRTVFRSAVRLRKPYGNALALDAGLVPEGFEKLVSDAVVRDAESRYGGFIHAGIFGIGRIPAALSRYGNAAAVCRIFAKEGENSFPFMWRNADATTLWEVLPVSSEAGTSALRRLFAESSHAGRLRCLVL